MSLAIEPVPIFYRSRHFIGKPGRLVRRTLPSENVEFISNAPGIRAELFSYFEEMSVERFGVLNGEYILTANGHALLKRDGTVIKINTGCEDRHGGEKLDAFLRSAYFLDWKWEAIAGWEDLPIIDHPGIMADLYAANYFHYTLEIVPRLRFFSEHSAAPIIISKDCVSKPFQRDLLGQTLGERRIILLSGRIRVRDPVLCHDSMSEEGMNWLREHAGFKVRPGAKRIYIRRSGRGTRSKEGGGIHESAAFLEFLRDYGFKIVDFGNGENGIEQQLKMLDGAGLVLAAHGAALSNMVYLDPPVTLIEILGHQCVRACFMHVCVARGLGYRGLFSAEYHEDGNMAVNLDELSQVIAQLR